MPDSVSFGYGCVIDAGSSGSRIYLYRWPKEEEGEAEVQKLLTKVEQEALFSDERSVGISDERGVVLLEDELLPAAKSALPSGVELGDVPIYLGATAGVRLASDADDIMDRVRSLLHASGFLFRDDWARTISGDEESVFGWLVANYLVNDGSFPDDLTTYGALDLGGASTQISVAVGGKDRYPLRIGNLHYPLYTESYLGYGADQARVRYDDKFLLPSSSKVSPCYPIGYTNEDVGVSGSSNWDECFNNVAKLFDTHPNLRGGEGGEDSFAIVAPPLGDIQQEQRYIAMSVFVFIYDFLGLEIGTKTEDLETMKDRAAHVCKMNHTEQSERYDQHMEDKAPRRKTNKPFAQCFNAAYSYHLLSKGYKMPVSDTPIEIYYDINGGKVQWALGMMLVEANKLSSTKESGDLDNMDSKMGNTTHPYIFMGLVLLTLILSTTIKSGRLSASLKGKKRSSQK